MSAVETLEAGANLRPVLTVVGESPTANGDSLNDLIDMQMHASIARTAFLGSAHIRPVSEAALNEGNARVSREFGADARRMLIVGPDTVYFDGKFVTLQSFRSAELLGILIFERRMAKRNHYVDLGFFPESISASARWQSINKATGDLHTAIIGETGVPAVTRRGFRGSGMFGIEDVLVKDLRHSTGYKRARERNTGEVVTDFVLGNGMQPMLGEEAAVYGARQALRRIGGSDLTKEQAERFAEISAETAALLEHRTDIYNAHLNWDKERRIRAALRNVIGTDMVNPWKAEAACRDMAGDNPFYPPSNFEQKEQQLAREEFAKEICDGCPVKDECLEAALERKETHGVWGGKTEKERKTLVKA